MLVLMSVVELQNLASLSLTKIHRLAMAVALDGGETPAHNLI
jgi:hypothetical protein